MFQWFQTFLNAVSAFILIRESMVGRMRKLGVRHERRIDA
jgi:hypothetical protein